MNRLAPLVSRRHRRRASFPVAMAAAMPAEMQAAGWMEDAKLFAAGWVAGLVLFGTLFG
jgi:hypothetical protein